MTDQNDLPEIVVYLKEGSFFNIFNTSSPSEDFKIVVLNEDKNGDLGTWTHLTKDRDENLRVVHKLKELGLAAKELP
jgi:hypothetical protein